MYSRLQSRRKGNEIPGVLLALEKAARTPNIHLADLQQAFGWESWSAFRKVYGHGGDGDKDSSAASDDMSIRIVDAESTARLMASVFEVDAIVNMLSVLLGFANGLQAKLKISHELIVSKLSRGMNSLPQELLTKVFQFAVWGDGCDGGRQAVRISHVCRGFRSIALGKRSLWTTLYSGAPQSQLEASISRAGPNEEFHVFYHFNSTYNLVGARSFLLICAPIMSQWKTLALTQEDQDFGNERPTYGGVAKILSELVKFVNSCYLKLSILEELDIRGDSADRYSDSTRVIAGYPWASNLRTFRCSFFLPYLSTNFSVSTFVVRHSFIRRTLLFDDFDQRSFISPLLETLLAMRNLTSFELEAHDANETACDIPRPKLQLPSITSFHLRLDHFPVLEFNPKGSCIAMLMGTLVMPSLEALSISVGVVDFRTDENEVDTTKLSQSLDDLSWVLLPDRISDTAMLTSLVFKLRDDNYNRSNDGPPADLGVFSIPLERIIHVHTVTLSSFVPVLLTQEFDDGGLLSTIINEFCRLRELKFIECENMTFVDLENTVDSLESLGIWSHIKRVMVQGCKYLAYDEVVDLVGEDRLQYLS